MKPNTLRSLGLFCVIAVLASLPPGRASASIVINFDTYPGGAPVGDNTLILSQYASVGVLFSSPAPAGGPLAGVFGGEASSGPNILVGLEPGSGGLHPIDMDFTSGLADTVDVTLISVGCGTTTATAYASDLTTILSQVSLTHGPLSGVGFGNHDPIVLSKGLGAGIARITFSIVQNGPVIDGFGIDDVEITLVPEPASAASLAAFGLLCVRRRR